MTPTRRPPCAALMMTAALAGLPAAARGAATGPIAFTIPAGPLDQALLTFAAQSRRQILFDRELTQGRTAPAVQGLLEPETVLRRLLAGTDIAVTEHPGVIVLKRPASGDAAVRPAAPATDEAAASPQSGTPSEAAVVGEVTVVGSLIRGAAAGPSPVVTLTREGLDRAGQATLADALSALPQTFNGTTTPQTLLLGTDGLGTNALAATGVNLRGLGANSTLVLVNGRRLAGAGARGDFVDISSIPTAAVDRVEVLLDGASALYGSDAVGGVVNVILRSDFDGADTRLRGGGATQGGDGSELFSQTFGKTWSTGRLVVSYEYQHTDALAAADRPETASADLRPLGGTDRRVIYSLPANILQPNASGAYVSAFAVPPGSSGVGLQPSDLITGGANLENYRALGDVLPEQTRHSAYLNVAQDLTPWLHLSADARYSRRGVDFDQPGALSVFQVTRSNPFYVSPTGASSEILGYAFGEELGPGHLSGRSEDVAASGGATIDLGRSWRLDVFTDYAQETDRDRISGLVNTGFLNEALGNTPDNPATSYSAARDGYFNPFGSGAANSRTVLDFIGSGYSELATRSRVETVDVKADGDLLALPGGEAKLAVGGQLRQEYFKTSTVGGQSGPAPTTSGGLTFARWIAAGFAELRVPIFGPGDALPGVRRLELSLAGRVEDYEDVGLTGDPKLGLTWTPIEPVQVRASYGTSFRAPSLTEVNAAQVIAPAILTRGSARVLSLIEYGGDANLRPETATTWTAGADWRPPIAPGLTLSGGFFDIDYHDRIGQPVLEDVSNALSDPAYGSFVQAVSPANNAADLAAVQALLARSTSASAGLFPASSYGAIVDARFVNTARLHVRGADFSASYNRVLGLNRIDLGFSATYLADYARTLTPTSGEEQLSGVTGQPAALRVRSTGTWTRGPWGATLGLNYVSGSTPPTGPHVDSYTTVDGQLLWRSTATAGPTRGIQVALNVANLFDTGPPFFDNPAAVGYDPANADVIGRTLSLQVIRKW